MRASARPDRNYELVIMKKPYYQENGISIYHGDSQEILPTLGKFDLLLTDPPYGINAARHRKSQNSRWKDYGSKQESNWDKIKAPEELLQIAIRQSTNSIIWGGNYFSLLPQSKWLVWDKMQRNFSLADVELAWTNINGAARCFSYSRPEALQDGKFHPTQKPVALMRWCLGQAKTKNFVLDCFCGSGSTLLAAKLEGLNAVGIESNERYCEIAADRLRQGVLF